MKITICGSMAFYQEMLDIKKELENKGHQVKMPPTEVEDQNGNKVHIKDYYKIRKQAKDDEQWVWDKKSEAIMWHFDKIDWGDSVLILNYDKNNIKGYIGGNTLMEIGIAFFLKKKIYLLNPILEISYKEEILGTKPIVLAGDLSKIK